MNAEASLHPGEMLLRRTLAAENVPADVHEHLKTCERCKSRVKGFEDEQRRFEAAIPFDRFAAGVERAQRAAAAPKKAERSARWVLALAAGLVVLMGGGVALKMTRTGSISGLGTNGIKGSPGIDVRVAAATGVIRDGSPDPLLPEPLAPGERVRIGYHDLPERFIAVVSIDEHGEVSAIYPADGKSLPLTERHAYLPDSLEFTGRGIERVIVIASKEPLEVEELKRQAKVRFDEAHGNLLQMGRLELPGEQFDRTFMKP